MHVNNDPDAKHKQAALPPQKVAYEAAVAAANIISNSTASCPRLDNIKTIAEPKQAPFLLPRARFDGQTPFWISHTPATSGQIPPPPIITWRGYGPLPCILHCTPPVSVIHSSPPTCSVIAAASITSSTTSITSWAPISTTHLNWLGSRHSHPHPVTTATQPPRKAQAPQAPAARKQTNGLVSTSAEALGCKQQAKLLRSTGFVALEGPTRLGLCLTCGCGTNQNHNQALQSPYADPLPPPPPCRCQGNSPPAL